MTTLGVLDLVPPQAQRSSAPTGDSAQAASSASTFAGVMEEELLVPGDFAKALAADAEETNDDGALSGVVESALPAAMSPVIPMQTDARLATNVTPIDQAPGADIEESLTPTPTATATGVEPSASKEPGIEATDHNETLPAHPLPAPDDLSGGSVSAIAAVAADTIATAVPREARVREPALPPITSRSTTTATATPDDAVAFPGIAPTAPPALTMEPQPPAAAPDLRKLDRAVESTGAMVLPASAEGATDGSVAPVPVAILAPSAVVPATAPPVASAAAARSVLLPQLTTPVVSLVQAPDGDHRITVTVSPENLGPVTVRAHISSGAIHIELHAPSDIGREALRAILTDLRRDLAAAAPHASLLLSTTDDRGSSHPQNSGQSSAGPGSDHSGSHTPSSRDSARPGSLPLTLPTGSEPGTPIPPPSPHSGIEVFA